MNFPWRLTGHIKILEKLEQDFSNNNLAQSYLFCGPKEIGKFQLLKTFTELLQCEQKNLCRQCDSCHCVQKNIHTSTIVVDTLWMKERFENFEQLAQYSNFDQIHRKKSGKKSDQIGVEDVQVFTQSLWQKSSAPYKLCLIRDMERMTEGAMNAFLKILEEPPGNTIFLLTSTHKESLLPTIISRTRVIEMGLVPSSVLRKQLHTKLPDISEQEQQNMLTLAQGRPVRLERFLEEEDFLEQQNALFQQLATLLKTQNIADLLSTAEKLSKTENERELKEFLEGLLYFLRTLLREKILKKNLSLGAQFSLIDLQKRIEATQRTTERIRRNVNKRLALEELMLAL